MFLVVLQVLSQSGNRRS